MVKENEATVGSGWFFDTGVYKRSQGRIARQVTFFAFAIGWVWGAYRLGETLANYGVGGANQHYFQYGVPVLVSAIGLWICFRLVNMPKFADFLIAVEAEMNKVSWPTRTELVRSSIVVMFTIFSMAILLFGYDLVWRAALRAIGVAV